MAQSREHAGAPTPNFIAMHTAYWRHMRSGRGRDLAVARRWPQRIAARKHVAPVPAAARLTSLESGLNLAWCRAQEHKLAQAQQQQQQQQGLGPVLVLDPFAPALVAATPLATACQAATLSLPPYDPGTCLANNLVTRYVDDTLLAAMQATNTNSINRGDYRQVVLVGDAFDTRPFRLPWPEGTLIFLVAPRSSHEAAVTALKQAASSAAAPTPHVPRGCLLRRVHGLEDVYEDGKDAPMQPLCGSSSSSSASSSGATGHQSDGHVMSASSFLPNLEAAGYQPARLSVWALQGLAAQQPPLGAVRELLTDITNGAAFNSLVLGELPGKLPRQEAANLLADFGLLATVLGLDDPAVSLGRAWPEEKAGQGEGHCWVFTSQQLRLSLAEMGVYEAHVAAAQETDEDWGGWNFS